MHKWFHLSTVIFSLTIIDVVQLLLLAIIVRSNNRHLLSHFYTHLRMVFINLHAMEKTLANLVNQLAVPVRQYFVYQKFLTHQFDIS